MSQLNRMNPDDLDWIASPGGAPGCFSKKLFGYGSEGLGRDAATNSYTTFYRFDRGAEYPTWRAVDGAVEINVLQGILDINGDTVPAGQWVQLGQSHNGWSIGSIDGCQIFAIVRGPIELGREA